MRKIDKEERWEISYDLYCNLMKMTKSDQYDYIYNIAELSGRMPIAYGFQNPKVIEIDKKYYVVWRRRSEF